jgi:hypothetical protein
MPLQVLQIILLMRVKERSSSSSRLNDFMMGAPDTLTVLRTLID